MLRVTWKFKLALPKNGGYKNCRLLDTNFDLVGIVKIYQCFFSLEKNQALDSIFCILKSPSVMRKLT